MPLTVLTLKKTPPSLRGDLTKCMQEISTGIYVGNFNSKVREQIWNRVLENVNEGDATICFASRNEIGYDFLTNSKQISIIDFDGIPLVMQDRKDNSHDEKNNKLGYSNVSKLRKARQFQKSKKSEIDIIEYIILDIETTGLDVINDRIIEIGCIKVRQNLNEHFHKLIKFDGNIPKNIKELTGITKEIIQIDGFDEISVLEEFLKFIENLPIVHYGNNFDINFINQSLHKNKLRPIKNQTIDLMRLVKKENRLLEDYKLQTVLKAYGIDKNVPHRALEDAKLIYELSTKVNIFQEKIKIDG